MKEEIMLEEEIEAV